MSLHQDNHSEKGFILVTSIILLAILMGLGAAAMFKTNIGIKVSSVSTQSAQAFAAAQSGLDYTFFYWDKHVAAGQDEFASLNEAAKDSAKSDPLLVALAPTKLDDIGATAAAIDTYVQTNTALRVYTLDGNMTPALNSEWNTNADTYAQVAVWTTIFEPYTYPYANPKSTACTNCVFVLYALGRSGGSYKLMREFTARVDSNIQAFGAMVNAPNYASCSGSTINTTPTSNVSTGGTKTDSHLIDSTQAPGGVAMASNNGVNISLGAKPWDTNLGTGTNLQNVNPWVVYDPGKVNVANYPNIAGDSMSNIMSTAVSAGRLSDPYTKMTYFADNYSQLFPLDAYREAANRIAGFEDEDIGGYTVTTGGSTGVIGLTLGNYLTLKTTVPGPKTYHRMGTLQYKEWLYNIVNSIPMYGIVRIMIPVTASGGTKNVCGVTVNKVQLAIPSTLATTITGITLPGVAVGTKLEPPEGNLIVYGAALFDFFLDSNKTDGTAGSDLIYSPSKGDRILTRHEALVVNKMNVDSALIFNPAMDGITPSTVAIGGGDYLNINDYPVGSPSWSEPTDRLTVTADGEMDLIYDIYTIATDWSNKIASAGAINAGFVTNGFREWMVKESNGVIRSTSGGGVGGAWIATDETRMHTLLGYYIRTTSEASKNKWYSSTNLAYATITDIENNASAFYIDSQNDLVAGQASAADLFHAFLPSGYVHGWKRAMDVSGLAEESTTTAGQAIWNVDLIGIDSYSAAIESDVFHITGFGANARIDSDFADVPAEMYAGGLVDMHHAVNISGVVYTPGQLELEQKDKGNGPVVEAPGDAVDKHGALQYIKGVVISGNGVFMKDEADADSRTIISYDDTSIDNLPTNNDTFQLARKYWQELK